jgi:Zn-dependent peptidase ImmA (M78 family)
MINKSKNKTQLAKELGVSRSSLYYKPKRIKLDLEIKAQIKSVLTNHSAYGHKRIAKLLTIV